MDGGSCDWCWETMQSSECCVLYECEPWGRLTPLWKKTDHQQEMTGGRAVCRNARGMLFNPVARLFNNFTTVVSERKCSPSVHASNGRVDYLKCGQRDSKGHQGITITLHVNYHKQRWQGWRCLHGRNFSGPGGVIGLTVGNDTLKTVVKNHCLLRLGNMSVQPCVIEFKQCVKRASFPCCYNLINPPYSHSSDFFITSLILIESTKCTQCRIQWDLKLSIELMSSSVFK